jgi:signal transduction histidine kinase
VRFNRPPADQRFIEPYSGVYFQVSGEGADTFPSRSLWDRRLMVRDQHQDVDVHVYNSNEFEGEPLRITERDVVLPGSKIRWRFQVAQSREMIDAQIRQLRSTLFWSFFALGIGLLILAALQTFYGLWPLRRIRQDVAAIRSGAKTRITEDFPNEVRPLTDEINQLLAHSEEQAEEARRHAGNLAHALKTPLTVITNAATAHSPDLADTVCREAIVMRRQVDHHLARARAIGRRASAHARATVWDSLESVQRAIDRLYENATVDIAGDRRAQVRVERQDLDEMIGNLVENAAKYGGGRVFVTVEPRESVVDILVEDDGRGIPKQQREAIFQRGARLDTDKPGTGLGLAIVRDVAEIYGGSITLEESDDLGGLLARLSLPAG